MLSMHKKVYKCLVASNIDTLPVNVMKLKIPGLQWVINTKGEARRNGIIQGKILIEYAKKHSSFVVDLFNGMHMIILDDFLSLETRMLHAVHEIGHIVCEHTSLNGVIGKSSNGDVERSQRLCTVIISPALHIS